MRGLIHYRNNLGWCYSKVEDEELKIVFHHKDKDEVLEYSKEYNGYPQWYVYVASPYTHESKSISTQRFEAVVEYQAYLYNNRVAHFGPICQGHTVHVRHDLPKTFEFWMDMDLPILLGAREVRILALDGWQESKGTLREIEVAKENDIPIFVVCPKTYIPSLLNFKE